MKKSVESGEGFDKIVGGVEMIPLGEFKMKFRMKIQDSTVGIP